ncbi:YaiO family outer membrane beta-barrel protein [Antarcticibacterium arcticum]|uniref:YaiO family outer membrane beta-barrel protein n=1 Tax=Antarcticibacterium arcticum TaxID=2585771 RepID=A0A5B8YFV1_9FLAO|nr:YaiO family outer membrane beta-barrel protein [Antarcticibacterium arcticum]QED36634.1 YaiO family outer membrane beta-barrel protein [Antarcticibacterium arcticum]
MILFYRFCIVFICLTSCFPAVSQTNPETSFENVRELARQNDFDTAIAQMEILVAAYPENDDFRLYLARLNFWNKDYEKATNELTPLFAAEKLKQEPVDLQLQIFLASQDYEKLLNLSKTALEIFPSQGDQYLLYQALAMERTGDSAAAIEVLSQVSLNSELFKSASYLRTELLGRQKNLITIGYLNTSFSNPGASPWHLAHLEYARKGIKIPYSLRVNYGHTFGNSAVQGEVDAYPKISKNSYLYLNLGFSDNNSVFPGLRMGGEYYYNFKKLSSSAGARYLKFSAAEVLMFTGSVSAVLGDYQLGYRPFLISENNNWFVSHALKFRRSFDSREAYVQLDLQYGGIPYYFIVTNDLLRMNSYRAGINLRFRIADNFFVQPILMYEREEFTPANFRNRFNTQLNLSTRF